MVLTRLSIATRPIEIPWFQKIQLYLLRIYKLIVYYILVKLPGKVSTNGIPLCQLFINRWIVVEMEMLMNQSKFIEYDQMFQSKLRKNRLI